MVNRETCFIHGMKLSCHTPAQKMTETHATQTLIWAKLVIQVIYKKKTFAVKKMEELKYLA